MSVYVYVSDHATLSVQRNRNLFLLKKWFHSWNLHIWNWINRKTQKNHLLRLIWTNCQKCDWPYKWWRRYDQCYEEDNFQHCQDCRTVEATSSTWWLCICRKTMLLWLFLFLTINITQHIQIHHVTFNCGKENWFLRFSCMVWKGHLD